MSVRTSHTTPPALTTTTCTSVPFTNPVFTTPSLVLRPETRTTTRWERTRHDRQRNEKTLRDREEQHLRKFGPSLRDPVDSGRSGQGPARQSRGADAGFPRHRRVEGLCLHLLWGAGPVCSATKKKGLQFTPTKRRSRHGRCDAQPRVLSTPMLSSPPCRVLRPEGSPPPPCGHCELPCREASLLTSWPC